MKKIIIMTIMGSLLLQAQFYRNDNTNIVRDAKTSLQWQDNGYPYKDWYNAIDYCRDLSLGGHIDWRLPNINELLTLVDYTKDNPAMSNVFAYRKSAYWSSTTYEKRDSEAWYINFSGARVESFYKHHYGDKLYVRCVRAGE